MYMFCTIVSILHNKRKRTTSSCDHMITLIFTIVDQRVLVDTYVRIRHDARKCESLAILVSGLSTFRDVSLVIA